MTSHTALDSDLARFRRRLALWIAGTGVAIAAVAALLATLALVPLLERVELEDSATRVVSIVLYVALLGLLGLLCARPLARLTLARSGRNLESRTPQLERRIETYLDRTAAGSPASPLLTLLAEDVLDILRRFPPERALPSRSIGLVFAASLTALGVLLWIGAAGPNDWRSGTRALWGFGAGALERKLLVEPGDLMVAPGTEVVIRVKSEGFAPSEATIQAQLGSSEDWDSAPMESLGGGAFSFRFVGVREPIRYQVRAGRVSSPEHTIGVLEVPRIEKAQLRLVYPAWTHREPLVLESLDDVEAVPGTRVEIELSLDRPLGPAVLIVNGSELPIPSVLSSAKTSFVFEGEGTYSIAAVLAEQRVRLAPERELLLLGDTEPEIQIVHPGRDRQVSAIEEVTIRVEARDDFHVDSITLSYSANGGEWVSRKLSAQRDEVSAEHVLALETLRLVPGDVIAYYAVARDRGHTVRSDMYLLDVRPFERRYVESQQSGGGGGGPNNQDDISRRQRQILIGTWNLEREKSGAVKGIEGSLEERAALVAEVQQTLREQTLTLIERARARGLDGDESIERYIEGFEAAAAEIAKASKAIGELRFQEAIAPEQRALQLLLRAEAELREMQVSRGGPSSGGGGADRSLSELLDLEMDPEKNRYEMPSQSPSGQSAEEDRKQREDLSKLEDLASRQERIAQELARQRQPTVAQRWQQEQLRRDLEELRRRMQASSSQEMQQRLNEASAAVDAALESQSNGESPREASERAQNAQRKLEELSQAMSQEQGGRSDQQLADLSERADRLSTRQRESADALTEALKGGSSSSDRQRGRRRGEVPRLDEVQERALTREKGELRSELSKLEGDLSRTARELRDRAPEASKELREAVSEVRTNQIGERLSTAQEMIEFGGAEFALSNEAFVTRDLETLRDRVQSAERSARGSNGQNGPTPQQLLRSVQQLRQRLDAEGEGAVPDVTSRVDSLARDLIRSGIGREQIEGVTRRGDTPRGTRGPSAPRAVQVKVGLEQIELALRERVA